MENEIKTCQRGFHIYEDIEDSHGAIISIKESSTMDGHVWIFCKETEKTKEQRLINPSPYLSIDQAKQVIQGLQKFIDVYQEN